MVKALAKEDKRFIVGELVGNIKTTTLSKGYSAGGRDSYALRQMKSSPPHSETRWSSTKVPKVPLKASSRTDLLSLSHSLTLSVLCGGPPRNCTDRHRARGSRAPCLSIRRRLIYL